MKYIKKYWPVILLVIFILYGGYLRLRGLETNYSFWMDEDHVAMMVRRLNTEGIAYLPGFRGNDRYQLGLYLIDSLSIRIFGFTEMALRLPLVVFGGLTIWAIYLLGRQLFNQSVGLIASFLTAFLQIEILWSRQARPYQGLQFCYLMAVYFIYRLITKTGSKKWNLIGFLSIGFLGASLHGLGALIIPVGLTTLVFFGWRKYWREIGVACLITLTLVVIYHIDVLGLIKTVGKFNNFFYYRVFLTHNYLPLCIMAVIGFISLFIKKKYLVLVLFCLFTLPQIFVVTFILPQPFIRYIYIIMPFLYILAGYGISSSVQWLVYSVQRLGINSQEFLITIFIGGILVFSLIRSNKLILTPRPYYSLNNDMQEVPEVDWKAIYQVVKDNGGGTKDIPLISNWGTTPQWYLGEKANIYLARSDGDDTIITSVERLKDFIYRYPSGIVVFDSWDNYISPEILQYCRDNMKLIYETDRLYPVQPRYWTVWVFRWETTKP